jgi:transcriptional regulator with XRE-family HTH domain
LDRSRRADNFGGMVSQAMKAPVTPGSQTAPLRALLREWRGLRHLSQHALALEAKISQRHLSFIESGRAHPSRDMVLRIADRLELPLRARNELLAASGFAPVYPERPLDASDMRMVRDPLDRILKHHEPYPAMVLDRFWNIVVRNRANSRIVDGLVDTASLASRSPDGRLNFVRLMFDADGIRPHVRNWDVAGPALIARVRREANENPSSPSEALLEEFAHLAPAAVRSPDAQPLPPAVPLELAVGGSVLRLINMLTTFGTPQDVGVQELRVEMSFPADDCTESLLREGAAGAES